ncbi:MAG: hypothetical protein ABSA11_10875 [Candidatus Bathyarchaeia archaeon]|jgi:hypothetical protein
MSKILDNIRLRIKISPTQKDEPIFPYPVNWALKLEIENQACQYLSTLGITATPTNYRYVAMPVVRIQDRALDFITFNYGEHTRSTHAGRDNFHSEVISFLYKCHFIAKADLRSSHIWKQLRTKYSSEWSGGELAQRLNSDSSLNEKLQKESLKITVAPDNLRDELDMSSESTIEVYNDLRMDPVDAPLNLLPVTRLLDVSTFEIYDRIAQHILDITSDDKKNFQTPDYRKRLVNKV